jgi:PAS domain S-box-containing protein
VFAKQMRLSFKTHILLLSFFICVVIIFLARATYRNNENYKATNAWIEHTQQVLYSAEQLLSIHQDIETSMRGFVITGQDGFLAPEVRSKAVIFSHLKTLSETIKDNPVQRKRVNVLTELTKKKIDFSELAIKKRKEAGFDEAKRLLAEGTGMRYMDSIRDLVIEIKAEENRLLTLRKELSFQHANAFNKAFIVQIIGIIAAILVSAILVFYNFTKRKKAERALAEKEKQLRSIIDNTSSLIFIKDLEGRFVLVNETFEKHYNKTKEAIIGKRNFDIFPRTIASVFDEIDKKVLASKKPLQLEVSDEIDGTKQYYISNKFPLYNSNGEMYGVGGVSTNITEIRKQADLIKDLYDNAPCGYYSLDAEGRFINANNTTLAWLGYTREELIGKPIKEILSAETANEFEQDFEEFKEKGLMVDKELVYIKKDGSRMNVLVNVSSVYDEANRFSYTRSTIFDITDRKKLEAELYKLNAELANTEWFKLVSKATVDAMWDYHISSGKLIWGEGFEALFGHKIIDLEPTIDSWIRYIHPDDKERVVDHLYGAINNKSVIQWSETYRYLKADNTYATVIDKGLILRDQNKTAYRMVGAMQDVTELKKNVEDLQHFSFIISHNFTGPLANLQGILSLINEETLDENNKQLLKMMVQSTQQLKETVGHLTQVLVIKNKQVELQRVYLPQVMQEVFSRTLDDVGVMKPEIYLDLEVDFITSNAYYLESIFQNLVSNSIKYRSADRNLSITITSRKLSNERTMIMYSDNGTGIDIQRHKDKLFGMYQRFHESGEGKGLGLFLIKSQITALGGSIELRSEVDKGTTFVITL